jgi:inhibitor of cysteine peptidase
MKKKLFFFSSLFLIIMFGCKPSASVLKSVDSKNIESQIKVKSGETFSIDLSSNPSTGYQWNLGHKLDKNVLKFSDKKYTEDSHPNGMVGVGGTETWKFTGVKKGIGYIHLIYSRGDESSETEKFYEVTVE